MHTQAYRFPSTWGAVDDPSRPRHRAGGMFSFLTRAIGSIRRGMRSRRAVVELAALDDRLLRDIGISRAAIGYCARTGRRDGGRA